MLLIKTTDRLSTYSARILSRPIAGEIVILVCPYLKLEYGPMPNVMVALPNIGGALCSTPQSLADAYYLTAVQHAATRNSLKLAGVPQTSEPISAVSGRKFTILWGTSGGHVMMLLLNNFFPIVDTCLSCEDIARQRCPDGDFWRLFCVLYFQRTACSSFQTCVLNLH